ncbi:CwfJ C-terminus 1-domain-containing protein-like protein [Exophiala viscosa]|uniref:CwfJ C-terminus 1-domain-containing protein-like protein n=1 Tax=Exophiala viscosa TaxID=2486360 RepID=UPI00218CE578|nr:CwfJ C-terminus 1-domain-containing protein-like protein [Exophiala viscosa]
MGSAKILVVGSVQGKLRKAFEKVSKLQAKQNFNLAIVVGDLFAAPGDGHDADEIQALISGQIDVALPTYFTVGNSDFPEAVKQKLEADDDLCPNLFYLGRKGTMTTAEGVKIVALGGRIVQNETALTTKLGKCDPLYLDHDARGLHGAHSAHILITNDWPANIANGSSIDLPESLTGTPGSQSTSSLCQALKPWYHFSSSPEALWEREPFKHATDYDSLEEPAVTRFKSLPSVAAPTKEWMTAFTLDTSRPPQTVEPPRQSPFIRSSPPRKRQNMDDPESYSRFSNGGNDGRQHKRARRSQQKDPSDCFMCLNKPGAKTHLVISLAEESMVTASRGPLPLPSTFHQLSSTGHVMIIPYYHAADEMAQGQRAPEEMGSEFTEMNKFRKALGDMIGSKSQGQLGAVCWEVNRTGIRHHHWQLIACQAELIKKGLVEAAFKVSAEKHEYPAFQSCEPDSQLPVRSDYFRVWTWSCDPVEIADRTNGNSDKDVGVTKSIFFPLPSDQKFNIWFGREVMAGLLKLENRVNWMDALLRKDGSEQQAEEEDAQGLEEDFEEFDFAMK